MWNVQQIVYGRGGAPLGGSLCFVFSCLDWKRKKAIQLLRVFLKGHGRVERVVEREPWNNNL